MAFYTDKSMHSVHSKLEPVCLSVTFGTRLNILVVTGTNQRPGPVCAKPHPSDSAPSNLLYEALPEETHCVRSNVNASILQTLALD